MSDQAAPADNYVLQALDLFDGYGEATAIVMGDSQLSYAAVANATRGLAAVLHEAGLGEDSAVAMLVSDRPESASLQLALHLLGCRTIWIATYAPRRQQLDYIGLAQADVLIYNAGAPQRAELVAELASQNPSLKIFALGGGTEHPDLLASIPEDAPGLPAEQVGASPESLFYTGGTTGLPKLVHHWQGFYKTMLAIAAYYRSVGEPPMRFLSGSTFSLVSGQLPAFLTLFEGGTFFITVGFDEGEFLRAIEEHKISSAFLTPTLLYRVIEHPDAATTDTSSLRYLNVGGAAAFPARLGEAIDILGPVVRIVYGSSELPLITDLPFLDHDPEHPERLKSAGKPFADTRIEIRDAEGTVLKPGESGEVWVSGSLMMAGYWQQPEATRETVAGGWVRTGDAGYLDEDGYLYLVDRLRDMIVTKGVAANVYARPIEDALVSHPKVLEAAVIGVPHERWGEAVHAVVVTEPGAEVTAEELQEFVRGELNNLYTPETVEFVTELPLTPLTKVDKKQLRQRHVERAAAQAAPEA